MNPTPEIPPVTDELETLPPAGGFVPPSAPFVPPPFVPPSAPLRPHAEPGAHRSAIGTCL